MRVARELALLVFGLCLGVLGLFGYLLAVKFPNNFLSDWGDIVGAFIGAGSAGLIALATIRVTRSHQMSDQVRADTSKRNAIAIVAQSELIFWLHQAQMWSETVGIFYPQRPQTAIRLSAILDHANFFDSETIGRLLDAEDALHALPNYAKKPASEVWLSKKLFIESVAAAYCDLCKYTDPVSDLSRMVNRVRFPKNDNQHQMHQNMVNQHWLSRMNKHLLSSIVET